MLLEQSHEESDEVVCDTKIMKISFVVVFDPGVSGAIIALATSLGEAEYGSTDNEFSSLFHPVSCEIFKNFEIFNSAKSKLTQLLQNLTSSYTLWACVTCEGPVHTFTPPLTHTSIDVLRAYLLSNIVLDPQHIAKTHNTCLALIGRDKVANSEKICTNSSSIVGSVASGVNEFTNLIEQDVICNFVLMGTGVQYPKREGKRCVLGTLFSKDGKYWVLVVLECLATLTSGVKIYTGTNGLKYNFRTSYNRPNIGEKIIKLCLATNPSQLEVVNLVVAEKIKAQQCYSSDVDTTKNMVISDHGNDYFVGQCT
ncbi:hypothetical protein V6N13_124870 [Hibiscus sabdariffa]